MSMDGFNLSEGGEGASGSAEVSAEQLEQYREQARQSAAQAKKDQKQEGKKKRQEDALAGIIVQFLKTPKYSGFFILISQALGKNIPSDLLLALLALIHKQSLDAVNERKIPMKQPPKIDSPFPPELSAPLKQWTTLIFSVSTAQPHKVLETVLDHDWKLNGVIVQLMSLVIREFFVFKKFDVPFENITSFSTIFLQSVVDSLEKQVQDQDVLG